jgi:Uma2 family endonuclease
VNRRAEQRPPSATDWLSRFAVLLRVLLSAQTFRPNGLPVDLGVSFDHRAAVVGCARALAWLFVSLADRDLFLQDSDNSASLVCYPRPVTARSSILPRSARRYVRPPVPIIFPVEEEMPESALHLRLRTALFLILERRLRGRAYVGSDQFVYWDATDPKACLAPDAFVRLGGTSELLPSYMIWKHGAPEVAVEIISESDGGERALEQKLGRYRHSGIEEVVYFDPLHAARPLRLWDRVEHDLVERELGTPEALRCDALSAYWHLHPDERLGSMLRPADGADGSGLWPTPEEAERTERAERDREREAAAQRIAELEAELRRRR